MKRLFTLLLCVVVLLSFSACGSSEETAPTDAVSTASPTTPVTVPTEAPTEAPTEPPVQAAAPSVIQLVDNDAVTVLITKIENNEHLGMQLKIQCVNKTDRALIFSWDTVSVCGFMYDPFWAEEVAPGKKVNSIIDFDTYALEQLGVESVDEISFTLSVSDSEEFLNEPAANLACTVYPTGKTAETAVFPAYRHKNGETVITQKDGLTFIIESVEDEVSEYYTLNCYIANSTDRNLLVSWDRVSVNGFMVDPFWASTVSAGKQLVTQIYFLRTDLEAQGIEDVSEIEFTLLAMDADDWDADYLLCETYTFNP